MKKENVVICIIGAVVVLGGVGFLIKGVIDKRNQAIQESIAREEELKYLEEEYIPSVYRIAIHEAFPVKDVDWNYYQTSEYLDEPTMYVNLYVYNEIMLEQDSDFEPITLDEVREYMDSSEITAEYVIDSGKNRFEVSEYGMSDRIKAYYEWFRGGGNDLVEDYYSDLNHSYNAARDDYPELGLPILSILELNYEQMCEVIELEETGSIEDFDASLFTENEV